MYGDGDLLLLGLGIALGMYFYDRTGYSPGGLITPGFLALELASPGRIAAVLLSGGAVAVLLTLTVRTTGIYGRQRTGAAMLLALGIRLLLGGFFGLSSLWIGWVIPGLLGADMQRQGVLPTLGATLATAFAASMAAALFGLSGGGV